MAVNILQYESTVWKTADLLLGAGIKQSDFPKCMMPFFALIMVESRLIRKMRELEIGFARTPENMDDFAEEFNAANFGYNDLLVRKNITLQSITQNDKNTELDIKAYLSAFDAETKLLLGVDRGQESLKFLDIEGVMRLLLSKKILFATVKAWAEIDLVPFNNTEITTLEEHIKRKWADISAETAGEQYTPEDIIALIADIIVAQRAKNSDAFLSVYDPTCGGGNLLFGVEDRIKDKYPEQSTCTFGEDWSDTLYALAKIESRFRYDSKIEYGNTLTEMRFIDKQFNVIVANPPYGVDWKGYEQDIRKDNTGRFQYLPSVADGQLLFTQHIIHQLSDDGIAVVVHNGSTLFSGDAGSGESNIRKYCLDNDLVEAIIQMPTDEFFNTGIYTYLWVFNKQKAADRRDRIILINAANQYTPLKKSRGKKRKAMNEQNRETIVKALTDFDNNEFATVFDKWHFYFNKQAVRLTNLDYAGKTYEAQLPFKTDEDGIITYTKSNKLKPTKLVVNDDENNTLTFTNFKINAADLPDDYRSLKHYFETYLKPTLSAIDYKTQDVTVTTGDNAVYHFDKDKETIVKTQDNTDTELGNGKISLKATLKKATKTANESIEITIELAPDYQKDYEIVPYTPDADQNQANIDAFMAKYVTKPFVYVENTVGVEVNFNKMFYTPEQLRPIADILNDLAALDTQLAHT